MEFTFLAEEQIFGNDKLDIFEKYGTKCAITDYAILKGCFISSGCYTSEGESLKNRTGYWWTKTPDGSDVRAVSWRGNSIWGDVYSRNCGARPALPYSVISSISSNKVRGENNLLEEECFWYPQTIVEENLSKELERAYSNRTLKENKAESYTWYEYKGKKYTRVTADEYNVGEKLSDGRTIKKEKAYWVEIEPIKFLIDEKKNVALMKKIIFSRVPFHRERNYKGDFANTNIKKYLDNVFQKDIEALQTLTPNLNEDNKEISQIRRINLQRLNLDKTKEIFGISLSNCLNIYGYNYEKGKIFDSVLSENLYLLEKYPILQIEYNQSGNRKSMIEILESLEYELVHNKRSEEEIISIARCIFGESYKVDNIPSLLEQLKKFSPTKKVILQIKKWLIQELKICNNQNELERISREDKNEIGRKS